MVATAIFDQGIWYVYRNAKKERFTATMVLK